VQECLPALRRAAAARPDRGRSTLKSRSLASPDIAELILALTQMSARSVIPLVAMSRRGETQWRA
jgi:hypothetical protein